MSNPDILEKRLQSWSPRRPSEKVARELFENGRAVQTPRRGERVDAPYLYYLWHWLTPVAACCLTVLVICSNNNRRVSSYNPDNASYFATVMLDTASSNVLPQTFALSKVDENIEWNVWPHATLPTTNFSSAKSGLRQVSNSVNGIYP